MSPAQSEQDARVEDDVRIEAVARALEALRDERLVEEYAVGGAVGATFYLEPVATVDVTFPAASHATP